MCLAQEHNAVTPVSSNPQPLDKHSSTEPLCSQKYGFIAGIENSMDPYQLASDESI